jgi:hypothetical protein
MYIEFRLPTGAGGMAAGHASAMIKRNIVDWAKKYNIKYKVKVINYTLRLSLESDRDYTLFQLSWNPDHSWAREYVLVEPMHQNN